MNLSLRRSTSALLASSLLLTIGRGATLPFMTIYLSRQYSLSVDLIGYAMTIALTIGVVFSLGFGILADKFDKKRYMLLAITAFASGFIAIPLVNNVTLVVLFFALINCAYSVFATVLKAWLGKMGLRNTSELTVRGRETFFEGRPSSPRYRGSKEVPCWRSNAGGTAESFVR